MGNPIDAAWPLFRVITKSSCPISGVVLEHPTCTTISASKKHRYGIYLV